MSIRTVVLGSLAALVAVGGIYLLIEVRSSGAAAPDDQALQAAADRHARGSGSGGVTTRPPRIEDVNAGGSPSVRSKVWPTSRPDVDRRLGDKLRQDVVKGAEIEGPDPAANPDMDAAMLEANKLYDRHNYEDARKLALKLLDRQPGTVRMLRVVVSSSCILGDAEMAQKYWLQLPDFDRGQMSTRCDRFGVTFTP